MRATQDGRHSLLLDSNRRKRLRIRSDLRILATPPIRRLESNVVAIEFALAVARVVSRGSTATSVRRTLRSASSSHPGLPSAPHTHRDRNDRAVVVPWVHLREQA